MKIKVNTVWESEDHTDIAIVQEVSGDTVRFSYKETAEQPPLKGIDTLSVKEFLALYPKLFGEIVTSEKS